MLAVDHVSEKLEECASDAADSAGRLEKAVKDLGMILSQGFKQLATAINAHPAPVLSLPGPFPFPELLSEDLDASSTHAPTIASAGPAPAPVDPGSKVGLDGAGDASKEFRVVEMDEEDMDQI